MKEEFDILRITRNNMLNLIDKLSVEQMNKIPEGFNNNLIWNTAHCIITQQLLIYKLSGADCRVLDESIEKYRKGSAPVEEVSGKDISDIKHFLIKTVDWLEEDYTEGSFPGYKEDYATSYNITLKNTEDAIRFNNVHEGLHLGYMMALKKCLQ